MSRQNPVAYPALWVPGETHFFQKTSPQLGGKRTPRLIISASTHPPPTQRSLGPALTGANPGILSFPINLCVLEDLLITARTPVIMIMPLPAIH